jgi:hypothetical protein
VGKHAKELLGECYWGAYCSHAILTEKIGVYHCPFGVCFKRIEEKETQKKVES